MTLLGHGFCCDSVPGFNFEFSYRNTCAVHMVEKYYSIYDLKKRSFKTLPICWEMLYEDLREIMDFDSTICKLWLGEYEFKFHDWQEARESSIYWYHLDNCLKAIKIYTCSCLFDTLVILTFLKIQCHEEIINKFNETFTQKVFSISLDHTINLMMICVESLGSFLFLFSLSINVLWTQLLNCIVRNVLENLYQNVKIIYQL